MEIKVTSEHIERALKQAAESYRPSPVWDKVREVIIRDGLQVYVPQIVEPK